MDELRIQTLVARAMQDQHIPGLALGVIRDGELSTRAFGLAHIETKTPLAPDTIFQIQSITKQFVAVAVMMLIEQGDFSLTTPIGQLLPDLPQPWREIAIRRILSHTSGIRDFIN